MKVGINLLLWTARLHDGMLPILQSLCEMGYDGVEVPIVDMSVDYRAWGHVLDDLGLERTAATVRTAAENPIDPNPAVRAAGIDATRRTIDACSALGATHLVGPLHSALGEFTGHGPTSDEWKWGVQSVHQMAQYAGQAGLVLAVESLNRFESYLLNTQADAARFTRDVDHPNCRILYDSFHSHIEEKNVREAILGCGELITNVHISENDRSTPGSGNVRWKENFDALHEIGYDGWMTIEAFGHELIEVAAATKIWRKLYDSEEQLAQEGLAFVRSEIDNRW